MRNARPRRTLRSHKTYKKQCKAASVTERDRPAGAAEMADLEAQKTHMTTKQNKRAKIVETKHDGGARFRGSAPKKCSAKWPAGRSAL